jgi:hypothetical protein
MHQANNLSEVYVDSNPRLGRPPRAVDGSSDGPSPDEPAQRPPRREGLDASAGLRAGLSSDRQAKRIAELERSLGEVYASAKAAGIPPDAVDSAFAILREGIAKAKLSSDQARRDSAALYERYQARHRRRSPDPAARPVIPDLPGLSLCPDPRSIQTPAELMDALRTYRIWAGKPSFRVMERQCGRSFAASTLCTALQGNDLPSMSMVQAIIAACGGPEKDQVAFTSAWRRITLPGRDAGQSAAKLPRPRILYPVS